MRRYVSLRAGCMDQKISFIGRETHQGILFSLLTACAMLAVPAVPYTVGQMGPLNHTAALQALIYLTQVVNSFGASAMVW